MIPQLQSRNSQYESFSDRPSTPSRNSWISPVSTPQGSPSKKVQPPGAYDLPTTFDNAMKLTPTGGAFGSPTKMNRLPGSPLSPGKTNAPADDGYFGIAGEESMLHKAAISPGSPLRKQGKENTPPNPRTGIDIGPGKQVQAAQSRQDTYTPHKQRVKKINTRRGLTQEEREILQQPNVKRLVNVAQLCRLRPHLTSLTADLARLP